MKKLDSLTRLLLKEAVRGRFFLAVAAAALLILAFSLPLNEMTVGAPGKATLSLSLSLLNIFVLFVIMVQGVQSMSPQVNGRLLLFILAKPCRPAQHLAAAAAATVFTVSLGMLIIALAAFLLLQLQAPISALVFLAALWLSLLEAILLTAFAAFFSVVTSPTLASFLTLFVYVIGHSAEQATLIMSQSGSFLRLPAAILTFLLPNLEFLNFKAGLIQGLLPVPAYLLYSAVYVFSYAALVFWAAAKTAAAGEKL